MRKSLSTRLYRVIFAVCLIPVFLALTAVEMLYDDLEATILDVELKQEQAFFHKQITDPDFQMWETARLKAYFLGQGQPEALLPVFLRGLPASFSDEIEPQPEDKTYLVVVEPIANPAGKLYLAQDISLMESREDFSQMAVISIALVITFVGFILSQLSARKLVRPLRRLTHQIQHTTPSKSMARLSTDYTETEYADIASAFNRFLEALEYFVAREKSFV